MARKPPKGKSLAELNPELAKQWHTSKNGDLNPSDVLPGSATRVWWKCDKDDTHIWDALVVQRNKGTKCPLCPRPRRIPKPGRSFAEKNPDLITEWHTTENKLSPYDYNYGSNEIVWWKCGEGDDHEWEASLKQRNNGSGCLICAGKKVVKSNSLATLHPELAKEWHLTKNGSLTPNDFTSGSNKKVWWKCDKGVDHEWQEVIYERTQGNGCTICSGRKIVQSNSLATLHPELAKEWHPTKNGNVTPNDVGHSAQDIWWKCDKGDDHEWQQSTNNRLKGSGCPICSKHKVVKSNCLATTHPEMAKEWHPTKNGSITPDDVTSGSGKRIWWKCDKAEDHEWNASPSGRNLSGCPVCAGQKVVKSNCLATTHPDLAKEWHPTKNGSITPNNMTAGSSKYMIWWICKDNSSHIWDSSVSNRTRGNGCPSCAEYGFNRSKKALFYIRMINLDNGKEALKIGITNNMDGDREKQQIRHVKGSVNTILRKEVAGEIALDIERTCKKYFGRKGFLTEEEFPDGFSETIKYSEENLSKIKLIVNKVLTEKSEKNN
jgi:hypothetical protein